MVATLKEHNVTKKNFNKDNIKQIITCLKDMFTSQRDKVTVAIFQDMRTFMSIFMDG